MNNEAPTDALRLVPIIMIDRVSAFLWSKGYGDLALDLSASSSPYPTAAPASPLPEGGGWRTDFENAPKDGSVFMVGYDDEAAKKAGLFENKDRVYEARWNDIQSTWSARNGFILHSDATHWMPLPAAPTGAK